MTQFDQELDTRGLSCPLPVLKTKGAIDTMQPGQVLKVLATDPGSVLDMQAFARQTRNPLLDSSTEGPEYVFYLRKNDGRE